MTKHSRQRDAVYAELCSRKDHPTADELYLSLRKTMPSISLATIYRNLSLLESEGKVLKIKSGNSDRFDGDVSEHAHFACIGCGRVIDIEVTQGKDEIKGFGGVILKKIVTYTGYCPECKNNLN